MFAVDLYRLLARSPGNLFVSPYSIETALTMVAAAAGGKTRDELVNLLGPDPLARYEALQRALAARDQPTPNEAAMAKWMDKPPESYGCLLAIANALWHQRGYPVAPGYVAALATRLGADVREADFAGARAEAVRAINAWAAQATRERIHDVISDVHPATRVVLANAIYFKARWAEQFSERATRPKPFTTAPGVRVDVPTMHLGGYFPYARTGKLQAIELPYSGGAIAMIVIVPDAGAFAEVERGLDVGQVVKALASRRVQLAMPKYRVESTFALRAPLGQLGLVEAFSPRADFSAISTEPGFAIDEVVHKTFVDVDERGTEAAAVTMPLFEGAAPPRDIVRLDVDRPFLFAIRDAPTGTVLFVGRVEDPR